MEISTEIIISVDSFLSLIIIILGLLTNPFHNSHSLNFFQLEPACSSSHPAASQGWEKGLAHIWGSLKDCIELYKLTIFTCDAMEKQRLYTMSSLTKPLKLTAHQHTICMEVQNEYLSCLPTLKDSAMVVASTEKGNKPFNKAMLTGMIMEICSIMWRNHYNLTHNGQSYIFCVIYRISSVNGSTLQMLIVPFWFRVESW